MIRVLRNSLLLFLILIPATLLHAQFVAGHIAVLQGDVASANNGTCTILEFNTTDAGQSAISSTAAASNFKISSSAGTTGYLANSNDGTLLCFTGVNTTATSNVNALNPRAVGIMNVNKAFSIATTYTGDIVAKNQTRGATSLDNTTWFIADQGGLYTNTATAASPAGNLKNARAFGGTVYIGSASATSAVSTIPAATGATLTSLPGVSADGNFSDFYLISSGSNGSSFDILYTISESSATAGTVTKYSLVAGTWTANGTYTTSFGGLGLAAKKAGTGAELYISSGAGGTAGNSLIKVTDAAGYNAGIAVTTANNITLYTASPATATIKGVAFTPTGAAPPPPTPSVNLSVSTSTASEAASTVVTVTATASAPVSGDQTMTLGVTGTHITSSDYTLSSTTITIPNGATTGSVTFTVINDTEVEDPETATLTISNPSAGITLGTTTAAIHIADDDISPTFMRITEYMYGGANGEFIEFTNLGTTDINMAGWSFSDQAETPGAVDLSSFGTVHAGESVILTETAVSTFRAAWQLCNGQKIIGGNTTNISRADEINIYDNNHLLVDRLTYDDQTLGGVRANNVSAWVNMAGLGSNTILNWTLSAVGDGENSIKSTGGDIGSPGHTSLATAPYNPCMVVVPGAPTIVLDVANTNDLIDGGITTSPSGSFAFSGVTGDATDPGSTLGVALAIDDDATPVNALTVTVTSSNTTVVPTANIVVTTTNGGAGRLIKVTPAAVGYSDITVTVGDGTLNTSYVLNYAASAGTSSSTTWATGISDASAAIPLDDNYMVIGDDEHNFLYVFNRAISGQPVKTFDYNPGNLLNLTDGTTGNWKELDVEASASSPAVTGRTYWLGSMSNSSSFNIKPNRDRLISVDISGTGTTTSFTSTGFIQGLRDQLISWGDAHGYNFTASAADGKDPKTIDGFNAEGMVFGPDNTTLYIGLRAPLVPVAGRTNAVIAPIANFETWFAGANGTGNANGISIGAPIELNLGGRGIRDLIKLPNGTYVIVAGSYDGTSNPALFRWTGNASDVPAQMPSFDLTGLNPEAALPVNIAGQLSLDQLQIISDDGGNVFYNDGIESKDLSEDNFKKFASTMSVSSLPGVLPVEFEAFTAQRQGADVQLGWTTGLPHDIASFDVLRSTDGVSFSRLTTVPATSVQLSYNFTDANTPATRLYYRIRANEYSGATVLSTIRVINTTGAEVSVKLYPNPVTNGVFTITTPGTGAKTVNVYNNAGSLYQQIVFTENAKDISTASWPKGYYLLRITLADSSSTTQKLVVQ